LTALKAEKDDLEKKLRAYADSDPEALKEMEEKVRKAVLWPCGYTLGVTRLIAGENS
jgi:hypothetical protein